MADDFAKLRAELTRVSNISALSRLCGVSRDHIQRIRDGKVDNTSIRVATAIRTGIKRLDKRFIRPKQDDRIVALSADGNQ